MPELQATVAAIYDPQYCLNSHACRSILMLVDDLAHPCSTVPFTASGNGRVLTLQN